MNRIPPDPSQDSTPEKALENSPTTYPHIELPDFDLLALLAKDDPDAFEVLREKICQQVIDRAPEHAKKRLQGLQFKVDMERQRSRTNVQACVRISDMMRSALLELNATLNDMPNETKVKSLSKCKVLPLFK